MKVSAVGEQRVCSKLKMGGIRYLISPRLSRVQALDGILALKLLSLCSLCRTLRFHFRSACQNICSICCWLWHLGNQMHYSRLHHERIPRPMGSAHKVHRTSSCYFIRTVCWKGRPKCAFCRGYGQRYL